MIGITHSDGYPDNFIKGKLCMMKNIEEFSASFHKKRDSRTKYRLVMIVLMFLIEMSNQYFYISARSEQEHIKGRHNQIKILINGNFPIKRGWGGS